METTGDPEATIIVGSIIIGLHVLAALLFVTANALDNFAEKLRDSPGMNTPWSVLRAHLQTSRTLRALRTIWYAASGLSLLVLMLRVVPRSVWLYLASLVAWFSGITFIQCLALRGKKEKPV